MKNHYIDNKKFEEIILLYQEDPKTHEEDLVSLFDLLITNIIDSFKFKVDPDDAKQECFALVLKTVKNFKPRKGTAFNYFTTIVINNILFVNYHLMILALCTHTTEAYGIIRDRVNVYVRAVYVS